MKNKIKTVFTILAASSALLCQQAQAVPISGNITFKGGLTLDTGNMGTANAVSAWIGPTVQSVTAGSSLDSTINPGDAVTMSAPWVFDPGGAKAALWSVGGFTYNLASSVIVFQSAEGLLVTGTGTITGPAGFDATPGTWNFSTQAPGTPGEFSFSAASGTAVPEGGLTVAMLGVALTGLGLARRKLSI